MAAVHAETLECVDGIPMPIVKLNRWILVIGISAGAVLNQPLVTTLLLALILPAALFGRRGSLIFRAGRVLFAGRIALAEREDWQLQRFNNLIATGLLSAAQVAFLLGYSKAGWAVSLMVATAAGIALLGFCLGCFLYFQFKLSRYRLFR